jgi:hypothetical protein
MIYPTKHLLKEWGINALNIPELASLEVSVYLAV